MEELLKYTEENLDTGLWPHQSENKLKIYRAWMACNSVMLQMPTGTGKTRLFSSICHDILKVSGIIKKQEKVLILAHRKELIEQISKTLGEKYGVFNEIIQGRNECDKSKHFFVASVQTLQSRLSDWRTVNFKYIIVDEAHHTVARTYINIITTFKNAKLLGVTATPYRLNKIGFTDLFENLIISPSVKSFIEERNVLCKFEYYSVREDSSILKLLDKVKLIGGEYDQIDLANKLSKDTIRAKIVDNFLKYAHNKKGIVYTVNREHNLKVCESFEKTGVIARAIDSKTPKKLRSEVVEQFRKGEIQVMCNVDLFSEGFDCPDIEFVQLARPTKSLSVYLQQVGRGLRKSESNLPVTIIDNVGLYVKFGLPSRNHDWKTFFVGRKKNEIQEVIEENFLQQLELELPVGCKFNYIEAPEEENEEVVKIDNPEVLDFNFWFFKNYLFAESENKRDIADLEINRFVSLFWPDDLCTTEDFSIHNNFESFEDYNNDRDDSEENEFIYIDYFEKLACENKYGIKSKKNEEFLLNFEYDEIEFPDIFGRSLIRKDSKFGIFSFAYLEPKWILEPIYSAPPIKHSQFRKFNLYQIEVDGATGIINASDKTKIPCIYESIFFDNIIFAKQFNGAYYDLFDLNLRRLLYSDFKIWGEIGGDDIVYHEIGFYTCSDKQGNFIIAYTFKGIVILSENSCILEFSNFLSVADPYYLLCDANFHNLVDFHFKKIEKAIDENYLIMTLRTMNGLSSAIYDFSGNLIHDFVNHTNLDIIDENVFVEKIPKVDNEWRVTKNNVLICSAKKKVEAVDQYFSLLEKEKILLTLGFINNLWVVQRDGNIISKEKKKKDAKSKALELLKKFEIIWNDKISNTKNDPSSPVDKKKSKIKRTRKDVFLKQNEKGSWTAIIDSLEIGYDENAKSLKNRIMSSDPDIYFEFVIVPVKSTATANVGNISTKVSNEYYKEWISEFQLIALKQSHNHAEILVKVRDFIKNGKEYGPNSKLEKILKLANMSTDLTLQPFTDLNKEQIDLLTFVIEKEKNFLSSEEVGSE